MTTITDHPFVTAYLGEFDEVTVSLPPVRRLELREEIAGHLREAIPSSVSNVQAAAVIADFGSPAEIVGQELSGSDGLQRTKPSRTIRNTIIAAVIGAIVVVALVVMAFAFGPPRNTDEPPTVTAGADSRTSVVNKTPTGPERIQEGTGYFEYLAAIKAMSDPLPAGAEYPDGVPNGLDSGPSNGAVLETGAGANVAHFTWLCAWEGEYLTAVSSNDAQRQVSAEAMLTKWPQFGYVGDPSGGWTQNVLTLMSFGDASGVKLDFPQTCAQAAILNVNAN